MRKPVVNSDKCIGCEACIEICPFNVINLKNGKAEINHEKCSNCRVCTMACPVGAIQ
ncbi:MAG: 4Fe-4S binding protein [Prolixibacteraceae bacterium]|nr:4Fe-4S binding protein [Prolixibacteraceae bacterium]